MALVTAAATAVGTTVTAAYLDAKFSLSKDIQQLWRLRKVGKETIRAGSRGRTSAFYLFEAAVSSYTRSIAIWSRTGIYTWQQVHDRACQYASFFLSLGVKPGQLVAVYLQNSPEFIFSWLALWAIGCAPAMINWSLKGEPLLHCLKISGATVMLLDAEHGCQSRINGEKEQIERELTVKIVTISDELKHELAASSISRPDDTYRDAVKGNSFASLIYTSGTTGLPKGVPFLMDRICLLGRAAADGLYGQRSGPDGDRWYNCMPMYHGTGGINAMTNIMAGISLAIGRKFSLSQFWNDVRESEATFFVYVGETARYLLAAPPSPLDKEHKIRCMHGNGLRPDVWAKFQERFGIPEVAEFFTATEGMFSLVSWCRGPYLVNTVGHHGLIMRRLFHNTYVPFKIDSATNNFYRSPTTRLAERVPYEEGGEIMVKVPNEDLFSGYYGAPEATSKKFARDVLRKGDLYYRPGDALRRTSDGRWFFMDRLGDTYRWKSENVSTAEVAEVLGTYPGIHEANVYGVLLPGHDGRAGCTAVSIDPLARKEFDWKAFTKFARRNLPDYAVPIFVRVVQGEIGGMGSHNNKQNKVPLREEGVDPKMKGRRVEGGEEDEMFWIPPQGDAYVKFEGKDWDGIVAGQARL